MSHGRFIALYGINNIGKSTQVKLLFQRLFASGVRVEIVKYPIYDLNPTGNKLNEILRGKRKTGMQAMIDFFPGPSRRSNLRRRQTGRSLFVTKMIRNNIQQSVTEEELQMWYSLNRYQFDPQIRRKLQDGISILAEDYTGTGLAWGSAKGADLNWLVGVNKFLLQPDLEILLDGKRFLAGKEKNHLHESSDRLLQKARLAFQDLAQQHAWKIINANQNPDTVLEQIWNLVWPLLSKNCSKKKI